MPDVTNYAGNLNPAKGREVSTALLALEAIHCFFSLSQNPSENEKVNFYNQTMTVGALWVHGMHKIFEQGVEAVKNHIKPKNSPYSRERNFFDYFSEKLNDSETIGRILGFLFDCPKGENIDAENLIKLSVRFIKMVLATFPKFEYKADELINAFSKQAIQRGNWAALIAPNKLAEQIHSQINTGPKQDETKEIREGGGLKP